MARRCRGAARVDRLSAAVDNFAAVAGQLLEEVRLARSRSASGRCRRVGAGCERRRQAIHAAYIRLRDPIPPVFDAARIYEELTDPEECLDLRSNPSNAACTVFQAHCTGRREADIYLKEFVLEKLEAPDWTLDPMPMLPQFTPPAFRRDA
jgi:hypothetical protein